MSKRTTISSGTKWEAEVGYSRAIRSGNHIYISGTTAVNENGDVIGKGDVYAQAKFILQKIEHTLKQAGAEMKDVVRTRMFITDISKWQKAAKAHAEFFKDIRPAATMVGVKALISPDLLIEIEADAMITLS